MNINPVKHYIMKIIKSEENLVEFDNGLKILGDGNIDCCANNYLDFEQLPVGTELPTMDLEDFHKAISIKEDGFAVKDIEGTPKWVQARSDQNGYYSNMTTLVLEQGEKRIKSKEFAGDILDR
jgi:hypothetical protein